MNGIIYYGNVYEVHKEKDCGKCAFRHNVMSCLHWREYCTIYEYHFRKSQSLTDKQNKQ